MDKTTILLFTACKKAFKFIYGPWKVVEDGLEKGIKFLDLHTLMKTALNYAEVDHSNETLTLDELQDYFGHKCACCGQWVYERESVSRHD